ncbi:hypothetical protein [Solimicrobium silvestre]|uniref:Bacterial SH3 domain n=1 Tax=Solimicrobium silvestre TaxID=2099400 RepID=A0A2S9GTY3_9BURK|nr:hypothetical protein [Solimicrobium silvestre]PRC91168.1 Bacterial SH3 domain [Solimicrobium silvestre]
MQYATVTIGLGIAVGLSILPPSSLASEMQPGPMWVVGSYVNIRQAADDKAKVIEHLTANTPIHLVGEKGRYCEISWAQSRSGFVACQFLGAKPLQLSDVERSPANDNDEHFEASPLRAFWIEPSFSRLRAAGAYFEKKMLTEAAAKKEADQLKAWLEVPAVSPNVAKSITISRFSVPEFDAMKALAKAGMQPPPLLNSIYPDVASLQAKPDSATMPAEHLPLLAFLPALGASRFSAQAQVGAMQTTTDQLSALFQIPYQVEPLNKPYTVSPQYEDPYIFGSWDIGDVNLSLVRPVHDVGIYTNGHVKDLETSLNQWDGFYIDYEATQECGSFVIDAHLHDHASGDYIVSKLPIDGLLMFFRSPVAVNTSTARVEMQRHELSAFQKKARRELQKNMIHQVVQYTVTLAGDFAPDFTVFELRGYSDVPGAESGTTGPYEAIMRYYFVNIGGSWKLLDVDGLSGCS